MHLPDKEFIVFVERLIERFITDKLVDVDKSVVTEAINASYGGKMVRAFLFVQNALDLSNIADKFSLADFKLKPDNYKIMQIACAIEIFQTAMLMQDDVIDQDQMRRGKKSTYIIIGEGKAIVLGDILINLADDLFFEAIHMHQNYFYLLNQWIKMKYHVMAGQIYDIDQTNIKLDMLTDEELSEAKERAIKICELKTASYTIVAPTILGRLYFGKSFQEANADYDSLLKKGVDFQLDNDQKGLKKDLDNNNISSLMVLNYQKD